MRKTSATIAKSARKATPSLVTTGGHHKGTLEGVHSSTKAVAHRRRASGHGNSLAKKAHGSE